MSVLILLVFLAVVIPLGGRLVRDRVDAFVMSLAREVEARGGTVLRVEVVRRRRGPFPRRGRGPRVVKLIYRDAMGGVRQLWGFRSVFGNELRWDYDDGDSRV